MVPRNPRDLADSVLTNSSKCFLFEAWFLAESNKYFTEIHTPKETDEEIKIRKNTFLLVWNVDYEESMIFLIQSQKFLFNWFLFNFPQFHGSSLFYNTSGSHGQHECNTSVTQTTRARQECYTNGTSAARMTQVRYEWKILFLITTRV